MEKAILFTHSANETLANGLKNIGKSEILRLAGSTIYNCGESNYACF